MKHASFLSLIALGSVQEIPAGMSPLASAPSSRIAYPRPEESTLDAGDGDLEVVVRHHPARRPQNQPMPRRRRRIEPGVETGALYNENIQGGFPSNLDQDPRQQYHAATALSPPLPLWQDPGAAIKSPVPPGAATARLEPPRAHVLELIIGVLIGILLSLLVLVAWLNGCWPRLKAQSPSAASSSSSQPHEGLDGGRLGLVQFHYQGAFFNQLSWTFERGIGTRERESDYVTMVLNERSQKVARGLGRLMSTPNGEVHLSSLGAGPGGLWCILKRPAPSRRPGQLWDFKVCKANGVPYSEVRQRSETKCLVNDAVTQRRMMTVIGNFTYPVFLNGERSIHVWITQPDGQSCMGAQCEAKLEDPEPGEQHRGMGAAESALPAAPARRFFVTTTANTDASLVLAVLLGLQDVHRAARRSEMPTESSSASTGSGWQGGRGHGMRISSGGSTAATSERALREHHYESAKAAAAPP